MLKNRTPQGPIKDIRVPMSDVEAAKGVTPLPGATSQAGRRFAVMGAAILEKLCRSGNLAVQAKRTPTYILDTAHGRAAISVMVSTISGDPATKHMIIPVSTLHPLESVDEHILVCAFVSKRERIRETHGGLNVKLAGWATDREALRYARPATRVETILKVVAVPVSDLHPIQTLRHYLSPKTGEPTCTSSSQQPPSPAQPPSAAATRRSSTPTMCSTEPSLSGPTAP